MCSFTRIIRRCIGKGHHDIAMRADCSAQGACSSSQTSSDNHFNQHRGCAARACGINGVWLSLKDFNSPSLPSRRGESSARQTLATSISKGSVGHIARLFSALTWAQRDLLLTYHQRLSKWARALGAQPEGAKVRNKHALLSGTRQHCVNRKRDETVARWSTDSYEDF